MGIVEKVLGRKESDTEQEIMTDGKPKGNPGQEGEARDSGDDRNRLEGGDMESVHLKPQRGEKLQPLDEIGGFKVRPGFYNRDGAAASWNGVSFTIHSLGATKCTLLLFRPQETEPYAKLEFPESYHVGNTYSMLVFGLKIEEFEYAFQLDGPYDREKGLLFDRNNVLLDPYAKAVTGQRNWGERPENGKNFEYHARVVENNFDWGKIMHLETPLEDLVIYELHVRGFTRHGSSGVEYPGTFAGLMEKIPYLKELGVNAVELMPIFEFDEMKDSRMVNGQQVMDYWGYNTVSFFAPNTSYAGTTEYNREGTELKSLIRELNKNGIECILDVVFNHTAEGNERGPFFSFKGFDNNIYYMLTPDGHYYNFSGCGNTLNCNHPIVQQMILECLRYWTTVYHIDGFRFDLASILGRNEDGSPMSKPPLLQSLAFDPILGNVKLIAEAWDAGGLYQVGTFPSWNRWAEWNGRYRDDMRNFLKGDYWMSKTAVQRITGSPDIYDPANRGYNASVNFLNCHDGFTLWDMYSYNEKHNEANGWDNTDGSDDNRSWNCGAEGETDNEEILALRRRLAKNAMTVLMMSRGTPMFLAGDEFLNTQFGNNNAYCQDNEISWLDWKFLDNNRDHFEYVKHMIRIRKEHGVIRRFSKNCSLGLPEIKVIEPNDQSKVLGIIYAGRDQNDGQDDIVCLAANVYWEEQEVALPSLPSGMGWMVLADTGERYLPGCIPKPGQAVLLKGNRAKLGARSVMVLSAYAGERSSWR